MDVTKPQFIRILNKVLQGHVTEVMKTELDNRDIERAALLLFSRNEYYTYRYRLIMEAYNELKTIGKLRFVRTPQERAEIYARQGIWVKW